MNPGHAIQLPEDGIEPEYYTIPRDEWERTRATYDAARGIAKNLEEEDDFDSENLWVGVTTTSGRRSEKAVLVEYQPTIKSSKAKLESDVENRIEQQTEQLEQSVPASTVGTAGEGKYKSTIDDIPILVEKKHPHRT